MDTCIIYHNPRWGKSRSALRLLRDSNIEPLIIEYIKDPPSIEELHRISNLLGLNPKEWIRKTEKDYKTHMLNEIIDQDKIFYFMNKYPKLIERPIVIHKNKAVIARPPERVLDLIKWFLWIFQFLWILIKYRGWSRKKILKLCKLYIIII